MPVFPNRAPAIKTIKGDLIGKVRVTGGFVFVYGNVNGNIIDPQKNTTIAPDDIEVRPGEVLIVTGGIFGNIEAENSHIHIKGDVLGVAWNYRPGVNIVIEGYVLGSFKPQHSKKPPIPPPSDNQRQLCLPEPFDNEKPVELIALLQLESVQKDYGSYMMVYERSFRKLLDGGSRSVKPTEQEIGRFRRDVDEAAKNNPKIAAFVASNPDLKLDFDINLYMELARRSIESP